jgi:trans-aconitate 2-methyltransferase
VLGLEVAAESPFREALERDPPPDPGRNVLAPGEYAELLHELGFTDQHVRLQVYGHRLVSTDEVVEWAKGTHLTYFRARLPDDVYAQYVDRYRRRLLDRLGERRPYFYAFKRILFWARLPRGAEA